MTHTHGAYAITGGLGGLGMRAGALVVEGGAARVLLASRSGRVVRDGQGLDLQLRSMGTIAAVVAYDSADASDVHAFVCVQSLTGVLHAAGTLHDMMLRSMASNNACTVFAPKALGACLLNSTLACRR